MSKRDETDDKAGLWGWALRKLGKSPAAWIGGLVGVGVLFPGLAVIPPVGALCMAVLTGCGAAGVAKGIGLAVKSAHAMESNAEADAERKYREEQERRLLEKLQAVGLNEDADVLSKMLEARDAIFKRCEGPDVDAKTGAPTLDLVAKIAASALHRSEELLDLTRRVNDPHLDAPPAAEETIAACRADLIRAYQAVADSRSRILLYKEPNAEIFASSEKPVLGSLAEQLEEETSVLEGIDRRLRGLDLGPEISPPGSQDTSKTTYSAERESD